MNSMKNRLFCSLLLLTISVLAYAIDYPTYRPANRTSGMGEFSSQSSVTPAEGTRSMTELGTAVQEFYTLTIGNVNPSRGRTSPLDCRGHSDKDGNGYCDYCNTPCNKYAGTPNEHIADGQLPIGDSLLPLALMALAYLSFTLYRRRKAAAEA